MKFMQLLSERLSIAQVSLQEIEWAKLNIKTEIQYESQ